MISHDPEIAGDYLKGKRLCFTPQCLAGVVVSSHLQGVASNLYFQGITSSL